MEIVLVLYVLISVINVLICQSVTFCMYIMLSTLGSEDEGVETADTSEVLSLVMICKSKSWVIKCRSGVCHFFFHLLTII